MAPQRGGGYVKVIAIFSIFFTILVYDVSKTTYENFGGFGCAQFFLLAIAMSSGSTNLYDIVNFPLPLISMVPTLPI